MHHTRKVSSSQLMHSVDRFGTHLTRLTNIASKWFGAVMVIAIAVAVVISLAAAMHQ